MKKAPPMNLSQILAAREASPLPVSDTGEQIPLSERLGLGDRALETTDYRFLRSNKHGVQPSADLDRVVELPSRELDLSFDLTQALRTSVGTMKLRPHQTAALLEAARCGGLLAPLGCGFGKTLVSLLLPTVLDSKCAVIMIPAALREQLLLRDLPALARHWQIRLSVIHVVSYSILQNAKRADILERIRPDLVVADECQNVRNAGTARTRRFKRYLRAHPEVRLCAMSGTMTTRSLRDYAHLAEFALKRGSPLPLHFPTVMEWASAIDVGDDPTPMGELHRLCRPGETVRSGFRRRLVATPGVVATEESALGNSLVFLERPIEPPPKVTEELARFRQKWCRLDGEEIEDALAFARVARQLAAGFFYRWRWPHCYNCGGKSGGCSSCDNNAKGEVVDLQWLRARQEWHREIRAYLNHSARPGFDSPLLLAQAAAAGRWKSQAWPAWLLVRHRATPPVETVWIDDFLVQDAVRWGREQTGIIWYEHDAIGQKIAEVGRLPFFGPGPEASARLLVEAEKPHAQTIVASIKAHGTGKNLQAWSSQLITTPPSNGAIWEQMLARTHRPGQQADEVEVYVYRHTVELREALEKAKKDAQYIEETTGQVQKLCYASYAF